MIKFIKAFLKKASMTPEEKYLSQSVDHVDLEARLKNLQRKGIWV